MALDLAREAHFRPRSLIFLPSPQPHPPLSPFPQTMSSSERTPLLPQHVQHTANQAASQAQEIAFSLSRALGALKVRTPHHATRHLGSRHSFIALQLIVKVLLLPSFLSFSLLSISGR